MQTATAAGPPRALPDSFLAWFFVLVWGSGFLATKLGLQYAAPFTLLTLRFCFGLACMLVWTLAVRPPLPASGREFAHVAVAGLLMHVVNLGGSHYAQYLGMSAGVTALILALQPLITAILVWRFAGEKLRPRQWLGVLLGLIGVTLVVWHKIDIRAMSGAALAAVCISLIGVTFGTLYQRKFCPRVDLRSAALIQFAVCLAILAPLAWAVEGMGVVWAWQLIAAIFCLVIFASILAVNALHILMRRGAATKVTSLLYLTPVIAVVLEFATFGVVPTALMIAGMVVACLGVALVNR